MKSKILFLSALSLSTFFSCNSDNKVHDFFEPSSCSIPKKIEPLKKICKVEAPIKSIVVVEEQKEKFSSDGLLKVVSQKKKNKVLLGKKVIATNFNIDAEVVSFECVNKNEYFLLTNESFTGAREEVINTKKALHCKLVEDTLQLIPMKIYADAAQSQYDSINSYAIESIHNFLQSDEEFYEEEENSSAQYFQYNSADKSFLFKSTFRNTNKDNNEEEFVEELGKFEYRDGVFYQVLEKQRKI